MAQSKIASTIYLQNYEDKSSPLTWARTWDCPIWLQNNVVICIISHLSHAIYLDVIDNLCPKVTLNEYVWLEGRGKRGANNITSCLYKDFKAYGYFDRHNYENLTIIADNCGG